ncbi:hypothetical protein CJ030_MR3G012015 [Morella rubra]|uniref:Uncharacterized protein n=1 Tax=Morella rubra TaxID=262757 RepID=A0A6A1W4J7_9ROSI|nr:hypothetical protein CJ030_MR3G012015 [Morella rubra]
MSVPRENFDISCRQQMDNVAKRLDAMQKEGAAKEKQQKEAVHALEQIEAMKVVTGLIHSDNSCAAHCANFLLRPECLQKAKRSYQKDVANFQKARDTHAQALNDQEEVNFIIASNTRDAQCGKISGGIVPLISRNFRKATLQRCLV